MSLACCASRTKEWERTETEDLEESNSPIIGQQQKTTLRKQGAANYQKSLEHYNTAIELKPKSAEAHFLTRRSKSQFASRLLDPVKGGVHT
jgi:hypothetical protein